MKSHTLERDLRGQNSEERVGVVVEAGQGRRDRTGAEVGLGLSGLWLRGNSLRAWLRVCGQDCQGKNP